MRILKEIYTAKEYGVHRSKKEYVKTARLHYHLETNFNVLASESIHTNSI